MVAEHSVPTSAERDYPAKLIYQRRSWFDAYADFPIPNGVDANLHRNNAAIFDQKLFEIWELGTNVILAWSVLDRGVLVLVCKHSEVIASVENSLDSTDRDENAAYVDSLLAIDKRVPLEELEEIAQHVDAVQVKVDLPFQPGTQLGFDLMSAIAKRYSISHVEDRAVLLFDMVGFSLLTPLEQVTQLNSLSCSINEAYAKLLGRGERLNFARTTTGDGFYIWNRSRGIDENIALYHLMMLILTSNASERRISRMPELVPTLRTCLHVGSHYEFYQPEALNPTTFSYIVGDVTIELARIIEHALPQQILIGDFRTPMYGSDTTSVEIIDSVKYMDRIQRSLKTLIGLDVSSAHIDDIRCYLTGRKQADGEFGISEYELTDKHHKSRRVYNAKLNVHLDSAEPIFLGLQECGLEHFAWRTDALEIPFAG